MDNLLSALAPVTDWDWLGGWLDVPESRLDEMTGKEDMLLELLLQHPCPSWTLVAWALYKTVRVTEHRVLEQLYGKHLTGMLLCTVVVCIVSIIIMTLFLYDNFHQLEH